MALVGDIIVSAREAFPDVPSALSPPTASGFVGSGASGTLPAATYYFVVTALNAWGETIPTTEQSYVAGGATSSIAFTPTGMPIGATSYRVYIGTLPGAQQGFMASNGLATLTITSILALIPGAIPTRSSAWNPDTDGGMVSAFTVYRWLNDALTKASRIAGGIASVSAIQAVTGVGMYRIAGRWIKFTNYWFDGWPMSAAKRADAFLHQPITAIPGLVSVEEYTDTTVIQLWPQPNRTGAVTASTGANMGVADTSVGVTLSSSFIAPGICSIDNEVIAFFSIAGNVLGGLMRGLGGTVPATHVSGATVTELNIRIAGFKQPALYSVGQSALSIPIQSGWDVPLQDYIVAQFRKAEQATQEGMAIEKDFEKSITDLAKMFRGKTTPTQIGAFTREAYGGSISGGLLIP